MKEGPLLKKDLKVYNGVNSFYNMSLLVISVL
jgi:hypothetical protein